MHHSQKFVSFGFMLFCTAVNAIAHDFSYTECPANQLAQINSTFKIKCGVANVSLPIIDWWKDNKRVLYNDSRYSYSYDGSGLIINNVKESDSGVYLIVLKDSFSCKVSRKRITLEVFAPPKVVNCSSGSATVGSYGQIRCEIYGFPKPIIYYSKLDDNEFVKRANQRLKLDMNSILKEHSYVVTLTFLKVETGDAGWFEFEAFNLANGSDLQVVYLKVIPNVNANPKFGKIANPTFSENIVNMKQPAPPGEPIITNEFVDGADFIKVNTTNEINLTWKIPPNNGLDIDSYQLKYCVALRNDEIGEMYYYEPMCQRKKLDAGGKLSSYVIEIQRYELNDVFYYVSLRAHNSMGEGPASERYFKPRGIIITTNYQTARKGEVLFLTCRIAKSTSLDVEWLKDDRTLGPKLHLGNFRFTSDSLLIYTVGRSDYGEYQCRMFDRNTNTWIIEKITLDEELKVDDADDLGVVDQWTVDTKEFYKKMKAYDFNDYSKVQPTIYEVKSIIGTVGGSAQIQCKVRGYPKPDFSFRKIKSNDNDEAVKGFVKQGFRPIGDDSYIMTLYFPKVRITYAGLYKCVASNSVGRDQRIVNFIVNPPEVNTSINANVTFGEDKKSVNLTSAEPPGEPIITNAINAFEYDENITRVNSSYEIELTWKIPSSNGLEIDAYQLKCCRVIENTYAYGFSTANNHRCSFRWLDVDDVTSSYVLRNRGPDLYYFVSLRAYNGAGKGPPSKHIFKTNAHLEQRNARV